jgi:hypothetical protein
MRPNKTEFIRDGKFVYAIRHNKTILLKQHKTVADAIKHVEKLKERR